MLRPETTLLAAEGRGQAQVVTDPITPAPNSMLLLFCVSGDSTTGGVAGDHTYTTTIGDVGSFTQQTWVKTTTGAHRAGSVAIAHVGPNPTAGTITFNSGATGTAIRTATHVIQVTKYNKSNPILQIASGTNLDSGETVLAKTPRVSSLLISTMGARGANTETSPPPGYDLIGYNLVAALGGAANLETVTASRDEDMQASTTWTVDSGNMITITLEVNAEVTPPVHSLQAPRVSTKQYEYKVYDGDEFISTWSNEVTTDLTYLQEINTAGSAVDIILARNPDNVGPGTDVFLNYNVDVSVFYGSFLRWVNHLGEQYVNQDGDEYSFAFGAPNGRRVFSGFVSRYIPKYSNNTVLVTLLGHGAELDNYIIEGGEQTAIISQTNDNTDLNIPNTSSGVNHIYRYGQTWLEASGQPVGSFVAKIQGFEGDGAVVARLLIFKGSIIGHPTHEEVPGPKTSYIPNPNFPLLVETSREVPVSGQPEEIVFSFPEFTPEIGTTYSAVLFMRNISSFVGVPTAMDIRAQTGNPYADGTAFGAAGPTANTAAISGTDLYFETISFLGETRVPFNSYDPSNILREIVDSYQDRGGRIGYNEVSIENTGTVVSYTFNVNSTFEGVQKILELAPYDWYWYIDQAQNLIVLKKLSTIADHVFTLGNEIEELEVEHTLEGLVNTVYLTGGEIGDPPQSLFRRYFDNESINTWRRGLEKNTDTRITLSDTMDIIADGLLTRSRDPRYRTILEVSAQKYNTENIRPGQVVGFRNFNNFIDDLKLQIVGLMYSPDKVTLQLDSLRPKVSKRIEDLRRNLVQSENQNTPDAPE